MFAPVVMVMLALVEISGSVGSKSEPKVSFPPARPCQVNLEALCTQGSGRPRYPKNFFPKRGYAHQRRCASAVNRVEAWYSTCCAPGQTPNQALCCAEQAWEYALETFCTEEFSVKDFPHQCCNLLGESRLVCFQDEAPNKYYLSTPGYTAPSVQVDLAFTWDPSDC